ncbi:thiosulfate:glutathione sulfurtransferase isoform X3 [Felis catus]|uniref:thiosulfate:glutathione sulfurtransferase isoform X3 n=1 Tax=Felis catus TaxID=9685 RepID=UPI000C2FDA12|nr:thiosulfate:glutathione sulfurtransferase isoform X3 [Felis catus]
MTLSPGAWAKPDRPRRAVARISGPRGYQLYRARTGAEGQIGRRCLRFRFRSRLREAGEMLRARRGRPGAAFLQLAVAARAMAGAPTVSLPELRSLLASGRARLIDVRSREEAAAGTIPGALNIPGLATTQGPIENGSRKKVR